MLTAHQLHQALKRYHADAMPCHNGVIVAQFRESDHLVDFKDWFESGMMQGWILCVDGLEIVLSCFMR